MSNTMKKRTIVITLSGAAAVILIAYAASRHGGGNYQFVTVARGDITEVVSVTGNTAPVQSLDLSFEAGGTVAAVPRAAGDAVSPGDVLVQLDTRDLRAQLAQAQASVDAAQANLDKLKAGPTPQSVQVSQTALTAAQQTLANTYSGVSDTVTAALAKANDAVRNQISSFYTSAENPSPQLTFAVSDSQVLNNANNQRAQASLELNSWQAELGSISPNSPTAALDQALKNASNHLAVIGTLLTTLSTALTDANGLSVSSSNTYKTSLASAVTEVNAASASANADTQSIAAEKASVAQAQAQLNLTLAGSTSQDIAAQQAAVAQAQANAQSIQVKIAKASLTAPIAGVVTVQNAKVGQTAAAGQTITSLISSGNLEIDANIPETDIGKIKIGNPVSITFDAFPGETFTGKIFYIDPAQTIVSGVVDYKVKASLDKSDSRVKSGLTANLTIQTQTEKNALILPQFAIIQNATGSFVEVLDQNNLSQIPVTLGIHDQQGNVEVLTGVTENEQVVNIGLKTQ